MKQEVLNALESRVSVRKYLPEMPPKADLETIIRAGLYAASGKNMQSAIIVSITDRKLRDRLMDMIDRHRRA